MIPIIRIWNFAIVFSAVPVVAVPLPDEIEVADAPLDAVAVAVPLPGDFEVADAPFDAVAVAVDVDTDVAVAIEPTPFAVAFAVPSTTTTEPAEFPIAFAV